jgi:hypothetical protein
MKLAIYIGKSGKRYTLLVPEYDKPPHYDGLELVEVFKIEI